MDLNEKGKKISWKDGMLQKLKEEEPVTRWAVRLQKKARKGAFAELKRKGLV